MDANPGLFAYLCVDCNLRQWFRGCLFYGIWKRQVTVVFNLPLYIPRVFRANGVNNSVSDGGRISCYLCYQRDQESYEH